MWTRRICRELAARSPGGLAVGVVSVFGARDFVDDLVLRRDADRFKHERLAEIDLAVALILTIKLTKWVHRCSPHP